MPEVCFTLELPRWLAQWYAHRCGGADPVRLPKGSLESMLTQRFIKRPPEAGTHPEAGTPKSSGQAGPRLGAGQGEPRLGVLRIVIPENKLKPVESWNHMPAAGRKALLECIRSAFDLRLFHDLVRPLFPAKLKKDLIWDWMEENGIETDEPNCWAVEKRFDRLRARMLAGERVKKFRKKNRNN